MKKSLAGKIKPEAEPSIIERRTSILVAVGIPKEKAKKIVEDDDIVLRTSYQERFLSRIHQH